MCAPLQGWLVIAPTTSILDIAFSSVETTGGWRAKPPAKLQARTCRGTQLGQLSVATSRRQLCFEPGKQHQPAAHPAGACRRAQLTLPRCPCRRPPSS